MTVSDLAAPCGMILFAFTVIYAGITDLTTMKIRNGLVLVLLLGYGILAPLAGFSLPQIGWSAALSFGVLLAAFIFFVFGWIGGGDAKFAAATVLWLGIDHSPAYLVYTALLGGLFTLLLLQFRTRALPAFLNGSTWLVRLHSPTSGVPYGVAMALAALVVFPQTHWMTPLF